MALTIKQENFCLAVVAGKNLSDAYREAYDASGMKPETVNRSAKELMDNRKIAARIAELRKPVIEKAQIDAAWVLAKLTELHELALADGEYSPANKSLELIGKHVAINAFSAEKVEVTGKDGGPIELTDTERAARIAALQALARERRGK